MKVQNPTGEAQIVRIKVYNLLYHFLRACHVYELILPNTSRQGARFLHKLDEIFTSMEQQPDLLGGLRVESTISAMTLNEAYEIHEQEHPDHIRQYLHPARLNVRSMPTEQFLLQGRELLNNATTLLRSFGITEHHGARELTLTEKKMFGDLKALLG